MTREEKNRRLAEWLEPLDAQKMWMLNGVAKCGDLWSAGPGWNRRPALSEFKPIYDFYTSEEANAMLLDKGRLAVWPFGDAWLVTHPAVFSNRPRADTRLIGIEGVPLAEHVDRKTAICEAALKLAEAVADKGGLDGEWTSV